MIDGLESEYLQGAHLAFPIPTIRLPNCGINCFVSVLLQCLLESLTRNTEEEVFQEANECSYSACQYLRSTSRLPRIHLAPPILTCQLNRSGQGTEELDNRKVFHTALIPAVCKWRITSMSPLITESGTHHLDIMRPSPDVGTISDTVTTMAP
ncbi:hypothetical protein EGR_04037 [Echinococcus granulosus]|uniref:Uncharacterized protein n=1 Tax=Echinococcus granulosus TaxID=6210 RepID=W6V4F0_ECHGR|nr:hypothetical protein EGR_04037 [Echinococcus granulosus]EUB61004.1 hypothetical protein EGR_04037 [Echinococcus granulosus]